MLAGLPLNEPIVQKGPFIMNEDWELNKAYEDLEKGINGFETSKTWKSKNQDIRFRNKSV